MQDDLDSMTDLPYATHLLWKHDLGGGGYALLSVLGGTKAVYASCSNTNDFPPDPARQNTQVDSVQDGIAWAEAKFEQDFPGHVCTDACEPMWHQVSGEPLASLKEGERPN